MLKIIETDVSTLQDVIESLAYKVAQYENPGQYDYSDKQVGTIIKCEGIEVEYD